MSRARIGKRSAHGRTPGVHDGAPRAKPAPAREPLLEGSEPAVETEKQPTVNEGSE